jgi:hypothetical protein
MQTFLKFNTLLLLSCVIVFSGCTQPTKTTQPKNSDTTSTAKTTAVPDSIPRSPVDTTLYNSLMAHINNGDKSGKWTPRAPLPNEGAVLPFHRIIAYYGNLYSKNMGILGELPKDSMIKKLKTEIDKWNKADTMLPAIPALHYIAVTAQGSPGSGNTYRLRMPFHQIETVIKWANEINGLVFLDVQVGQSTIEKELPLFEKYLLLPNVHFGIDPEFSMKTGKKPGSVIGTFDAADINYVVNYLDNLVKKNNLPPKVLIIHRFTQAMITNYKKIKPTPNVQIVMNMDGWGSAPKKINTYKQFVYAEPVQFTGFKIFYKNDTKRVGQKKEMQPEQVLKLVPHPVYIQYQ